MGIQNNKPSLNDFHEQWKDLVEKAFKDFYSLKRDERVWFTVQCLIQDVDNGGLISHYYNSGADYNKETIEDLIYIGFPEIAKMLTQINNLFPNGSPPLHLDERNEIISSWEDEEYDNLFNTWDNYFFEKEGILEESLMDYIRKKIFNDLIK